MTTGISSNRVIDWGGFITTVPLDIIQLYCDGSATPSKPASYGYVVVKSNNGKENKAYTGMVPEDLKQSSNIAEYMSVIRGLNHILTISDSVHVFMDSQLVVYQIQGRYQVRDTGLKELYKEVRQLITRFKKFDIEWIPRAQNLADKYSR